MWNVSSIRYCVFAIVLFPHFALPQKLLFYFIELYFGIFYGLIPGFLIPLALLFKLKSNLPELFSDIKHQSLKIKSNNFYVQNPEIFPQRDFDGEMVIDFNKKDSIYINVEPFITELSKE